MSSTEILPQEKTDTKESQASKVGDQKFNKLENTLKNKIPNDEKKYNKFLTIFQNIKKQEIFSEDKIYSFIENTKINLLDRQLGQYNGESQTKIVIEQIDKLFGGIIKVNKTTEASIKEKSDVIKEKSDVIKEKSDVIDTNTDLINITKIRQATEKSYDTLDPKYKVQEGEKDKVAKIKNTISPKKKEALAANGLDIDTYSKFMFTKESHGEELKKEGNTEFLNNLEKLETMFPTENITMREAADPNITDSLIQENEELNEFTKTSERFDNIATPSLPETKGFEDEFTTYVKFIPDEAIRKNIEKNKKIIGEFKEIYDKFPDEARNEKGKLAYDEYMSAIAKVKEQLPKNTQDIIKQRVLGSCINGLAKYFETSTINQENFANDFDINTQKGYSIQKSKQQNEKNDDILYINGNIQGNDIGFYYNLNNPDAQLQSDDFLNFNGVSETFSFGNGTGGKKNLGIQLPTIEALSKQAQGVSERNFTPLLEKATNLEEFEASFKETISTELLKNYGQEALVKSRVERDVEKNRTTQTLHTTFIPEVVATEMSKEATNKITNHKARKLLEIRDTSTENMGAGELRTLRSLVQRLDPLIGKEQHKNLEPKRERLLGDMEEERGSASYDDQRGSKTLKFFKKFSKDKKIDLDDLGDFITSLEKNEGITDNISKFSPDFQTKEEQEEADSLLENIG